MAPLWLDREPTDSLFVHGFFLGGISLVVLYSLYVFALSRKPVYVYFACMLCAATLFELAVSAAWNERLQSISTGIGLVFAVLFARLALQLPQLAPRLDKGIRMAALISLVLAGTGFLLSPHWLIWFVFFWFIAVVLLIITAGVQALKQKQAGSLLFLFAWVAGLSGALLFSGQVVGLLPSNGLTVHALRLGIVINMTLLSFSQVSRIHTLQQENARLEQKAEENYQLALVDALTGVPNRRAFDERLANELERGKRDKSNITLMMIDIDYFKLFNDTYGHQMGDDTLIRTALIMRSCLRRPGDALYRYGGEEFSVILADTDTAGALHTARRILTDIRELCIPHKVSPFKQVTVSIGVAVAKNANIKAADFIQLADQALYQAKRNGRNTVISVNSRDKTVVNIVDYFKNSPKDRP